MNMLWKTDYYLPISLAVGLMIHMLISDSQLLITYTKLLMLTLLLENVVCFEICLRLLTKSGTKD